MRNRKPKTWSISGKLRGPNTFMHDFVSNIDACASARPVSRSISGREISSSSAVAESVDNVGVGCNPPADDGRARICNPWLNDRRDFSLHGLAGGFSRATLARHRFAGMPLPHGLDFLP
jgi:hypothetical protein